jgi:hypothetical protein
MVFKCLDKSNIGFQGNIDKYNWYVNSTKNLDMCDGKCENGNLCIACIDCGKDSRFAIVNDEAQCVDIVGGQVAVLGHFSDLWQQFRAALKSSDLHTGELRR